jgi:Ser/Thr protein kinase RdoA (MazF antagonist)
MHGELRQVPRRACMDPAPPRKRRIDASSSIFRQVRGVVADRKAFHDDPDAAKHKLARWQSSQRKASAPFAASSANASISWQDLEGLGRPRVSNGRVAAFVAENFGLTVTAISRLTGERDLNFRATAGGRSYVIKVANASESRAQLECEHAAMLHVARHLARLGGGTPLETPTPLELCGEDGKAKGGTIACIEAEGGAQHLVRVLSFIEGRMWSSCEVAGGLAADFAASLGRTAALLDGAMLSFAHPAAAREHAWDLAACQATVRAYLPEVGTQLSGPEAEAARALVLHFVQLHEAEVAPLLRSGALPRSCVHQDLNDNNVVCDAQGRVLGAIDFGDMNLTETCNNLAVALAYAFFGRPKPLEVLAEAVRAILPRTLPYRPSHAATIPFPALVPLYLLHHPVPCYQVRGYSEMRAISPAELRALYPLACMRVCTTVVMAAHSAKLDPDNAEYLTISQAPAWEALRVLRTIDPQHATAVALEAGGAAKA